jgi:hypothetical protein
MLIFLPECVRGRRATKAVRRHVAAWGDRALSGEYAHLRRGSAARADDTPPRSLIGYLFHCLMTDAWRGSV